MKNQFLMLTVISILLSCQDKEMITPSPSISDKWLSFESTEQLRAFIEGKNFDLDKFKMQIQDFEKKGFKPLMPYIRQDEIKKIEAFKARKIKELQRFEQTYNQSSNFRANEEYEVDMEFDAIVADPYFASLLNEDREILIGKDIYKFTEKGLFFTEVTNYEQLKVQIQRIEPCPILQTQGTTAIGNNVYAFMPAPIDDCGGGGCTTCGSGGSSGGPSSEPTREEIRDNLKICEYREGVLNILFGPSEKCIDEFSERERIKVKTWAQDYLIFSSTGIKVKSQNRVLGVWWADKIDELELGYSAVSFKYSGTGSWPTSNVDFHYEMNGYTVDQYGRYVSGGSTLKKMFNNFPVRNKSNVATIYIFKPLNEILEKDHIDITGKDVNKQIQSIVKTGYKKLTSALKKEFNSNEAVLVFPDNDWNSLIFIYTNWRKIDEDENKISNVFDWSTAQIGIKINSSGTSPTYGSPQKPKDFQIVGYGMGRRGSKWRGGRVVITN